MERKGADHYAILSRPDCVWCERAKGLILSTGGTYDDYNVREFPSLKLFLASNGVSTVPQVFQDGEWIGGYEDLKAWVGIDDDAIDY